MAENQTTIHTLFKESIYLETDFSESQKMPVLIFENKTLTDNEKFVVMNMDQVDNLIQTLIDIRRVWPKQQTEGQ